MNDVNELLRLVRRLERLSIALERVGNHNEAVRVNRRLRRLRSDYARFRNSAGAGRGA